jgi:hypothetical protein
VAALRAEGYERREETLAGWTVSVESYSVDGTYYCTVSSADAGARFARAQGQSRAEAERAAVEKAARYLAQTRRHPSGGLPDVERGG